MQQQQQMAMATPFVNPLAAFGFGGSPFGGLFPGMEMMDPFAGGGGKYSTPIRISLTVKVQLIVWATIKRACFKTGNMVSFSTSNFGGFGGGGACRSQSVSTRIVNGRQVHAHFTVIVKVPVIEFGALPNPCKFFIHLPTVHTMRHSVDALCNWVVVLFFITWCGG